MPEYFEFYNFKLVPIFSSGCYTYEQLARHGYQNIMGMPMPIIDEGADLFDISMMIDSAPFNSVIVLEGPLENPPRFYAKLFSPGKSRQV